MLPTELLKFLVFASFCFPFVLAIADSVLNTALPYATYGKVEWKDKLARNLAKALGMRHTVNCYDAVGETFWITLFFLPSTFLLLLNFAPMVLATLAGLLATLAVCRKCFKVADGLEIHINDKNAHK